MHNYMNNHSLEAATVLQLAGLGFLVATYAIFLKEKVHYHNFKLMQTSKAINDALYLT